MEDQIISVIVVMYICTRIWDKLDQAPKEVQFWKIKCWLFDPVWVAWNIIARDGSGCGTGAQWILAIIWLIFQMSLKAQGFMQHRVMRRASEVLGRQQSSCAQCFWIFQQCYIRRGPSRKYVAHSHWVIRAEGNKGIIEKVLPRCWATHKVQCSVPELSQPGTATIQGLRGNGRTDRLLEGEGGSFVEGLSDKSYALW